MKKVIRMICFSAIAVLLTAYWNKGFIISNDPTVFIKLTLAIAISFYFVIPVSKLILLPLNILTLGMMSFIIGLLILNLLNTNLSLIIIKEWVFTGFSFAGYIVPKFQINYLFNLILSSFSISLIINLLEKLL